eukprot:835889_1
MTELTAEMEKNIRSKWVVGDWVEVYSKSRDQWFRAKIIEIYDDDDGEWLAVVVENTMIKEVQRFTPDVRPLISTDDDDSDSEIESSGSESADDSDSMSYSESDEDEKERELRKRKKAQKQLSKHHELVLVFVERTGSNIFNGKYVYSTTTEEGYPIFAHVDNRSLLIKQNEDDMRWEFIDNKKKQVFYYADSDKEFPPSSGWKKTKHGDLPNPGVRLDQIRSQEQTDNFFEDDPYKFSPFFIMKYKFEKVKSEPLGFDLKILQLHSQFVAVKSIKPDSQAETFGILPGDILVSANEVDLSKMTLIEDVSNAIKKLIMTLYNNGDNEITITFAREKKTYKVLICQRAGSREVNGRYNIQGKSNGALFFAQNDNVNIKIMRIYVNEEEDEALWAIREVDISRDKTINNSDNEDNYRDYYIVLAGAKDEVPPSYAWEAVEPHGVWPAPGLLYHDALIVAASKPRIVRTQPNPSTVQIHFECDEEERKPKACPHMECWYEIEMSHYKYNADKGKTSKRLHDTTIWKCAESPFVANELINGDDYAFIVRTRNHITATNSDMSPRVTPLQLPPKPKIIDITGRPGELYIHFHCKNANNHEVQAKFELSMNPPIDEECQDYDIRDHRLLVDNDNKPVRIRNIVNGTKYQIIVASVNSVGVTYSEPESAYASKEPPQPVLAKVVPGNREITVHFTCDGYDKPDVRAWFELDIINDLIPHYRQSVRYSGSPVKISPVVNGLAYIVRVKAVTLSGCKISAFSAAITAKGPPPIPTINVLKPLESAVQIEFVCQNDYATEEYQAEFEIESFPSTHLMKCIKISPHVFPKLVNGMSYQFRIRGVNKEGRSNWSERTASVTPLKIPPQPTNVRCIPTNGEITVFWICEDLNKPEYSGWFEVESDPNTFTLVVKRQEATFKRLDSAQEYTFTVKAVNNVGHAVSNISEPCMPQSNQPMAALPSHDDTPLSLHRFCAKDLCYYINEWVINDINYKFNLSQMKRIFSEYSLTGQIISKMKHNGKRIVQSDLLSFMTQDTIDIMFDGYDKFAKHDVLLRIESKSADQIAEIVFSYPLDNLLKRITEEAMNGEQFIESIDAKEENIISKETGWKYNDVYQIQAVLFKHQTFTEKQFQQNMNYILNTKYAKSLSKQVVNEIKETILQHNAEEIHYKIKNGHNIEEFSDCIVNMVDRCIGYDDNIQSIYDAIADCFIFDTNDDLCMQLQQWICNNCGNCNITSVIDSALTTKIDVCILCGVTEREQIILKLKNNDTYVMVHDMNRSVVGSRDDEDLQESDAIELLIQEVIKGDGSFNLLCPSQNDNNHCQCLLRLAKMLLKYKRWLDTIYKKTKGKDAMNKTVEVNIAQFVENDSFKLIYMKSVKAIELITENQTQMLIQLVKKSSNDVISDLELFLKTDKTTFSNTLQDQIQTSKLFGSKLFFAITKALKHNSPPSEGNHAFKRIIIDIARRLQSQTKLLTEMFENTDQMADVQSFLSIKRIKFAKMIQKCTKLGVATGTKLYSKIHDKLKNDAQTKQFGQFLSDLDMNTIVKDYQHILNIHIKQGNKTSIENVFRFFGYVIHYEDSSSDASECRSLKRRENRVCVSTAVDQYHTTKDDNKDIWRLKQYYNQSQLDIIHSYLVHSNWQRAVQRYTKTHSASNDTDDELYDDDDDSLDDYHAQNKGKYTTELTESDTEKYGFGLDHSHPYLKPVYDSIHDEIVLNELHRLTPSHFHSLLIKAIKSHHVALEQYQSVLQCKYFQPEYNLIRNEPLGLRHILSIIMYTDISAFCTVFRQTFRRTNNESSMKVTKRHLQLYYYARSLYESVEFFGEYMRPRLKVYHGLNRVLFFTKFTAYFNQPISCTTQLSVANQFSEGKGIILTLRAATEYLNDPTKKVKFLGVSWLSSFPNEDEKLFYGQYVVFKICNIFDTEGDTLTGHAEELLLLNQFQKTVQNETVGWKHKKHKDKHIEALALIIKQHQNIESNHDYKTKPLQSTTFISTFGISLFNHFCDSLHTICIKNFKSLPKKLSTALLIHSGVSTTKSAISLIPITKLFKQVKQVVLNELYVQPMTLDAKKYVNAVWEYVTYSHNTSRVTLQKIVFKSMKQNDGKENSALKQIVSKHSRKFGKHQWDIRYEYSIEKTHDLIFTTNKALSVVTANDQTVNILTSHTLNESNQSDYGAELDDQKSVSSDSTDNSEIQKNMTQIASKESFYTNANKMPSYFMQITHVDQDEFRIEVLADRATDKARHVFIKDLNRRCNKDCDCAEFKRIKLPKGQLSGGKDIDIGEKRNTSYRFALYPHKTATEPISTATQLELIVLQEPTQIPPHNTRYKPKTIDLSTVCQVRDVQNERICVYWSTPSKSFGRISYKIVKADRNENKGEIVSVLPYCIPFSAVSSMSSFKVITCTVVDDCMYESKLSDSIIIM